MAVAASEDAVRSVVMDYLEGWFEGDAGRMKRALHPEMVKRCRGIEGDDPDALETLSSCDMIEAAGDGEGRREDAADRRIEIRIDHLSGGIASAQCFCHRYVDLLHLIEMPDGWKIVNAAWRQGGRQEPASFRTGAAPDAGPTGGPVDQRWCGGDEGMPGPPAS